MTNLDNIQPHTNWWLAKRLFSKKQVLVCRGNYRQDQNVIIIFNPPGPLRNEHYFTFTPDIYFMKKSFDLKLNSSVTPKDSDIGTLRKILETSTNS